MSIKDVKDILNNSGISIKDTNIYDAGILIGKNFKYTSTEEDDYLSYEFDLITPASTESQETILPKKDMH